MTAVEVHDFSSIILALLGQYSTILKSRLKPHLYHLAYTNMTNMPHICGMSTFQNLSLISFFQHTLLTKLWLNVLNFWTGQNCIKNLLDVFLLNAFVHILHKHSSTINVNKTPYASQTAAAKVIIQGPMYATHYRHTSTLCQKKTK